MATPIYLFPHSSSPEDNDSCCDHFSTSRKELFFIIKSRMSRKAMYSWGEITILSPINPKCKTWRSFTNTQTIFYRALQQLYFATAISCRLDCAHVTIMIPGGFTCHFCLHLPDSAITPTIELLNFLCQLKVNTLGCSLA